MTWTSVDPDFDVRIADWLENDPDHAPGPVLPTVVAAFPLIKQRRASRLPWRTPTMNRIALFGATAAALVAVGVGGLLLSSGPNPSVGGQPIQSPSPTTSSSPAAQAIPDGTYTTGPMSVADIDRQLDAEEALTDADKESIRNDILAIRGRTTLESAIEVDGTVMRGALGYDGGPLTWDSEGVSEVRWIDGSTYEVDIQCCGTQRYGVEWNGDSFSLIARSPATGNVELFVRRIIHESQPFSPVP